MTRSTLLVVDDEPLNLALLSGLLGVHYRVLGVRSGAGALALLERELPDLILLDVMMPGMDGYAVLEQLKAWPRTAHIPVIFITALSTDGDEETGLERGAVDYIVKPIRPAIVLARVRTHLELKSARDRLADENLWLEQALARRIRDSLLAQDLTLHALAELAETRDNETGNHIVRTQRYIECLARQLQHHPAYAAELDEATLQRIVKAAPLHDIGKIGIRDHILLKPGRLTPEEFAQMKTHARIGGDALGRALQKVQAQHPTQDGADASSAPEAVRYLEVARLIACHHHERWDGSGYPDGLRGTAIPLAARLMALADVFDALIMPRVYKPAWTLEATTDYIRSQSGAQFDPALVEAFEAKRAVFAAIAAELSD